MEAVQNGSCQGGPTKISTFQVSCFLSLDRLQGLFDHQEQQWQRISQSTLLLSVLILCPVWSYSCVPFLIGHPVLGLPYIYRRKEDISHLSTLKMRTCQLQRGCPNFGRKRGRIVNSVWHKHIEVCTVIKILVPDLLLQLLSVQWYD